MLPLVRDQFGAQDFITAETPFPSLNSTSTIIRAGPADTEGPPSLRRLGKPPLRARNGPFGQSIPTVEVCDTGPKSPLANFQAIFEEFHQLDNAARERSAVFRVLSYWDTR